MSPQEISNKYKHQSLGMPHGTPCEGFCSIENKNFPTKTNKNKARSDLRDAKQRAGEIRSTYPRRSHNGNVQMNVVSVVVLAVFSSRSDPIQRRKWRRLWEMHTYNTPTTLPSRSSEIWWSGRWDRQHDGVVSIVESFCRQGFACLHGGRRTEKGGFKNRATAPHKLGHGRLPAPCSFYRHHTTWSRGRSNLSSRRARKQRQRRRSIRSITRASLATRACSRSGHMPLPPTL
jgi:hypothetical protein